MPVQASVQIFKMCINQTPRNTEVTAEKLTPRTAGYDPTGNRFVCVFWVVGTLSAL